MSLRTENGVAASLEAEAEVSSDFSELQLASTRMEELEAELSGHATGGIEIDSPDPEQGPGQGQGPSQGKGPTQNPQGPGKPLRELDTVEECLAEARDLPKIDGGAGLNGINPADFGARRSGTGNGVSTIDPMTQRIVELKAPDNWHQSATGQAVWDVTKPSTIVLREMDVTLAGRQQSPFQAKIDEYVQLQVETAALRGHAALLERFRDQANLHPTEAQTLKSLVQGTEQQHIALDDQQANIDDMRAELAEQQQEMEKAGTLDAASRANFRQQERALQQQERQIESQRSAIDANFDAVWAQNDAQISGARTERVRGLVTGRTLEVANEKVSFGLLPNTVVDTNHARQEGFKVHADLVDSNLALDQQTAALQYEVDTNMRATYVNGIALVNQQILTARAGQQALCQLVDAAVTRHDLINILGDILNRGIEFKNEENIRKVMAFLERDFDAEAAAVVENGYKTEAEKAIQRVSGIDDTSFQTDRFQQYKESLQGIPLGPDPQATLEGNIKIAEEERARALAQVVDLSGQIATIPGLQSSHLSELRQVLGQEMILVGQIQESYETQLLKEGRNLALNDHFVEKGNRLQLAIHRQEDVTDWANEVALDQQKAYNDLAIFLSVRGDGSTLGKIIEDSVEGVIRNGTRAILDGVEGGIQGQAEKVGRRILEGILNL
ncbi:MAG: hypothetical protein KDD70_06875 [Bdellovibrionales bacterium]|nr:hypothetical protein [Bdellovibrionales bacterium]